MQYFRALRGPGRTHLHRGIAYDLQVDTTHAEALACAQAIAARLS